MKIAIGLSLVFLAMYVAYHMTSDSTPWWSGNDKVLLLFYFDFSYCTFHWNHSNGPCDIRTGYFKKVCRS